MRLVSIGIVKWKGAFTNESWYIIGRSTREEHLALVRESEMRLSLAFRGSVISGIPSAWTEATHAWKVSVSTCDTQRNPLLFFLTLVFNLRCSLLSTFPMDAAWVQYLHFTGFSQEV